MSRAILAFALGTASIASVAHAQSPVVITDGQSLSAEVGARGIIELRAGDQTWRFLPADPLVVRLTSLAGNEMSWSDHAGDTFSGRPPRVGLTSGSSCRVLRAGCSIPGATGTFTLALDYEVVPAPQGPGVAVRVSLEESTLEFGIAAIGYRQHLDARDAPETVIGGFTGAIELSFDDLSTGTFNVDHPYLVTGGLSSHGYPGERYLTTRSSETMLVAATHHPRQPFGLLITRDGRHDPDNTGREFGFFGGNDLRNDQRPEFGFGTIAYLPNDDRLGNGGIVGPIGAGLVIAPFAQENADDPYWDVVRAYRDRWVDPMLDGIDKAAERPDWLSRSVFMVLNVDRYGVVEHDAVSRFVDEYLQYHDAVEDLAILLWGATDAHRWEPLPGLAELIQRLEGIEIRTGVAIRPSLYYLPTNYRTDETGGTRLDEVARDPFGDLVQLPNQFGTYTYRLRSGSSENAEFFAGWLDTTLPPFGIDGVYFDDAFRDRTFYTYHYDATLPVQGRTSESVAGVLGHMDLTNAYFARRQAAGYLISELGIAGRSIPGNLVQGGPDIVQSLGPLFESPERVVLFRPFLNDVAGHHWLSGYSGDISHHWLALSDYDDLLYFATPVVHGLLPVQAPFATQGRYYDFFQLCAEGIIDCENPLFRAVGVHSDYANDATAFFRRHNDVLTGWRRQPLPGSHDIAKRDIAFRGETGDVAYRVRTDELPYGCFGDGDKLAIAVTNPTFDAAVATFLIARDRYGMRFDGAYQVTVQPLEDEQRTVLLRQAEGDLAFRVRLEPRAFAMIEIEPAAPEITPIANASGCTGGTLAASVTATATGHSVQMAVSGAPPATPGALVVGLQPTARALPWSACQLLVDLDTAFSAPLVADANGAIDLTFAVTSGLTTHVQYLALDPTLPAVFATNALRIVVADQTGSIR